jgi:DtxR family Mn-dependent transcriptional regulator
MASQSEENYLKNIYLLEERSGNNPVTTNELSEVLNTKAASVTDMLQRLSEKKLLHYKKYQGVLLTLHGKGKAISIIRKHRLWEYFLVEKLKFQWDEVHPVAEELEHISSDLLVDKLDGFLGRPKFDPHGDPIPNQNGKITPLNFKSLSSLKINDKGKVAAVVEQQPAFLKHLDKLHIHMGTQVKVVEKVEFDKSMGIVINNNFKENISFEIAKNILIAK